MTKKEWHNKLPKCPYCGKTLRTMKQTIYDEDEKPMAPNYFWYCECDGLEKNGNFK